jgi:hypothetical protein
MAANGNNTGKTWSSEELKQLRELAKQNTPTRVIALKMGRTPSAIQSKASAVNISLRPTNQSPYSRAN